VGSVMIRGDGTYAAEIPVGTIQVAVETVSVKYQDREEVLKVFKENGFDVDPAKRKIDSPAFAAPKMTYVEIPERFQDPAQSGLECTVAQGKQVRDFDLK
jgi:hypothetical protein